MKMLKSKKGFKTLVTILALVFVAIVFLIFFSLFRAKVETGPEATKSSFQSIDTELILKTFLQTPTIVAPDEIGLFVGDYATTSDLLARTCDSTDSLQFYQFNIEATDYFTRQYGKDWHLELVYYSPDGQEGITPNEVSAEAIGHTFGPANIEGILESSDLDAALKGSDYSMIAYDIALLQLNIRDNSMATQILPCKEGPALVKVILFQWAKEGSRWP